jgi:microcystin degradation protein MlrC
MPRILIAECKQEISSFNPVRSRYEDFAVHFGADILKCHRELGTEIGGALRIFAERSDVELAPTYSAAMITCGGPLAAADFTRIEREFLGALKEAPPADGVFFAMHGAMAAENEDDVEGHLLAETRRILGEKIPIVVSLDLHGILTDRIVTHADAVVSYQTYPHIDFMTTGERAARLLLRLLAREVTPVTAKVDVPALVRGDELITETGLIRHVVHAAQRAEQVAKGLSAGMFWSNPFTDVPSLCSTSFVITDSDASLAEKAAIEIAEIFWRHHEGMQVPLTSVRDAARIACENKKGTVVLVDAADATSSGASGDSNAIMRALIEAGFRGTALVPIVDAPAAEAAFEAGVGKIVRTRIGGQLDPARFRPLPIEGRVHLLSEGLFRSEKTRELWNSGRTAVVETNGYTVILISRPVHLFDRALFYAHGQDPRSFEVVVVKSPQCESHMFRDWAAHYVDVDAPGATSANLRSLGHQRCPRPMFPFDPDVSFTPRAKLFRRPGP